MCLCVNRYFQTLSRISECISVLNQVDMILHIPFTWTIHFLDYSFCEESSQRVIQLLVNVSDIIHPKQLRPPTYPQFERLPLFTLTLLTDFFQAFTNILCAALSDHNEASAQREMVFFLNLNLNFSKLPIYQIPM